MAISSGEAEGHSGIQVLARAVDILRLLHGYPGGLSQSEIGERLGLARSTVSRLLMALDSEGLVMSLGPRGRYRLGPELIRLAASARRTAWLDLHPLLVEFSFEIGETVDLSVLEGDRAIFVDQVVADNRLRAVSAVGDLFPMPAPDVNRVLGGRLESLTENTLVTAADIRAELERIRAADGVAFDREEQSVGVSAIGAVIGTIDHDLLALSIPVPTQRFTGREAALQAAVLDFVSRVDVWIASRR